MFFMVSCNHQQVVEDDIRIKESTSVSCNDVTIENAINQLLQKQMMEMNCSKGVVYVVETATGAIKAKVALAAKGKNFTTYEDTFNEEQCDMMMGPTYLALLSTRTILPEYRVETGSGIYKDVKDYNWYRGGWGSITIEEAFYLWSKVGFTRLKEDVYENNMTAFDRKMKTFLAEMPYSPIGMLTFYNAVANGGKMVKLTTGNDDAIILNERIAEDEHIKALQKGMCKAVKEGLLKKAGKCNSPVAASGRSFETKEGYRRMELCGYFPTDCPQYTIMIILEKKGGPASAGGMCGPIMASIVDKLSIEN